MLNSISPEDSRLLGRLFEETRDINAIVPYKTSELLNRASNLPDENIKEEIKIFILSLMKLTRNFLNDSLEKLSLKNKDIFDKASEYGERLKSELQGNAPLGTASEYLSKNTEKNKTVTIYERFESLKYLKRLKNLNLLLQEKYLSLNLSEEARAIGDDLSELIIKLIDNEKKDILFSLKNIFSFLF